MRNLQVNKTRGNELSALGLYILSRGLHLCTLDLQISCTTVHEETHEEHSLDKWIIPYRTRASHEEYMRDNMRSQ